MAATDSIGSGINRTVLEEGADILRGVLAKHVEGVLKSEHGEDWWRKGVYEVLRDKDSIPEEGSCSDLKLNQLLALIGHRRNLFGYMRDNSDERSVVFGSLCTCGYRLSDDPPHTFDGRETERHLDTMVRFCRPLDEDKAQKIDELYCRKRFGTSSPPPDDPMLGSHVHAAVSRGLQILVEALSPLVSHVMGSASAEGIGASGEVVRSDEAYDDELDAEHIGLDSDLSACLKTMKKNRSKFSPYGLNGESYRLLGEVRAIRNRNSHGSAKGTSQRDAERDLDILYSFCLPINKESAERIDEIYRSLRNGLLKDGVAASSSGVGATIDVSDLLVHVDKRLEAFKKEIVDEVTEAMAQVLGQCIGLSESRSATESAKEACGSKIQPVAAESYAGEEIFRSPSDVGAEAIEETTEELEIESIEEELREAAAAFEMMPYEGTLEEDTNIDVAVPTEMYSSIVVPSGVTLTVKISDTLTIFEDACFIVHGSLVVRGAEGAKVVKAYGYTPLFNRGGAIFGSRESEVCVYDCSFQGFDADFGGAIDCAGILNVARCEFSNCTAYNGGAVNSSHKLHMDGCIFSACSATARGGAVNCFWGEITNCEFEDCDAAEYGNAVYAAADTTVDYCRFKGYATQYNAISFVRDLSTFGCSYIGQGEIANKVTDGYIHTLLRLREGREENAETPVFADGVIMGGTLSSDECIDLTAPGTLRSDLVVPKGVTLILKISSRLILEGDSRFSVHGAMVIEGSEGAELIRPSGQGAAVYVGEDGSLSVSGCRFAGFISYFGGAINSSGNLRAEDCRFENCQAKSSGGAVYASVSEMIGCTFAGCAAGKAGNAIYLERESNLSRCTFRNYEGKEQAIGGPGNVSVSDDCEFLKGE